MEFLLDPILLETTSESITLELYAVAGAAGAGAAAFFADFFAGFFLGFNILALVCRETHGGVDIEVQVLLSDAQQHKATWHNMTYEYSEHRLHLW